MIARNGAFGEDGMSKRDARTPDEALLRQFQDGDATAFETLFQRYEGTLRAAALGRVSPAVQAKVSASDILQEARITAYLGLQRFEAKEPGALRIWLLRVVERKALEAVRRYGGTAKRATSREAKADGGAGISGVHDRGPSPSEAAARSELADAALRALSNLSTDHQEVLRLTRLRGLSLAEAATRMGRTREAVKKLYARALAAYTHELRALTGSDSHG